MTAFLNFRKVPPAGFTLIEVLVVVLIMGLMIGLTQAIIRPSDLELLQIEAERLAQLLNLADEESLTTGKAIGWTTDGETYRFWRFQNNKGWMEIGNNDLLRRRTLNRGMRISGLRIETLPQRVTTRLEFSPYRAPLSFTVALSHGTAIYSVTRQPDGEVRAVEGRVDGQVQ